MVCVASTLCVHARLVGRCVERGLSPGSVTEMVDVLVLWKLQVSEHLRSDVVVLVRMHSAAHPAQRCRHLGSDLAPQDLTPPGGGGGKRVGAAPATSREQAREKQRRIQREQAQQGAALAAREQAVAAREQAQMQPMPSPQMTSAVAAHALPYAPSLGASAAAAAAASPLLPAPFSAAAVSSPLGAAPQINNSPAGQVPSPHVLMPQEAAAHAMLQHLRANLGGSLGLAPDLQPFLQRSSPLGFAQALHEFHGPASAAHVYPQVVHDLIFELQSKKARLAGMEDAQVFSPGDPARAQLIGQLKAEIGQLKAVLLHQHGVNA